MTEEVKAHIAKGRTRDQAKHHQVLVTLPERTWTRLHTLARLNKRPMIQYIQAGIRSMLRKYGGPAEDKDA